jgi:hypothetical protein
LELGVADAVALEGVARPVELPAVELGDQLRLAPDCVDFVAGDLGVGLRPRETRLIEERDEGLLELPLGAVQVVSRQQLADDARAAPAGVAEDLGGERAAGDPSQRFGLCQRTLDLSLGRDLGEIDDRSCRVVTGMCSRWVVCARARLRDVWTWMPGRERRCVVTVTSGSSGQEGRNSRSAVARRWLATAVGPQARTAAIAWPCLVSAARPRAYTPRWMRNRRPRATR